MSHVADFDANWAAGIAGVVNVKRSTAYPPSRNLNPIFSIPYCTNDSGAVFHTGFAVCSMIQRRKSAEPPSTGRTTNAGLE
jgi:hypothetical protein